MERLQRLFRFDTGTRFFVLYGQGLSDCFITRDYVECGIEGALHRMLKLQGFERIAFYSPRGLIYFLDTSSRDLSRPRTKSAPARSQQPRNVLPGLKTPLGNVSVLHRPEAEAGHEMNLTPGGVAGIARVTAQAGQSLEPAHQEAASPTTGAPMGDAHVENLMDAIMQSDQGPRSALVFNEAESTFRFFEDPRGIVGRIGEWARMNSANRNVCIFLFATDNYEDLQNIAKNLQVPDLSDMIRRRADPQIKGVKKYWNVERVACPEEKELARLVEYVRLMNGVQVNFAERETLLRWMAVEDTSAREWLARLRNIRRLDRQTAYSEGWISSVLDIDKSASQRLSEMVGLKVVKERVDRLSKAQKGFQRLEREEKSRKNLRRPSRHMLFLGGPGTGKTEVAKLIGEIYRDIGILSRGHLVNPNLSQIISENEGGTIRQLNQLIDKARGGVLLIDEAYQLAAEGNQASGSEAITTLVTRIEDERDLVVVLAGYPYRMARLLQMNEGLESRFPPENRLVFEDYNPAELYEILERKLNDHSVQLDDELKASLLQAIEAVHHARDEKLANGRGMEKLADGLVENWLARIEEQHLPTNAPLTGEDLPASIKDFLPKPVPEVKEVLAELDHLIGMTPVKTWVRQHVFRIQLAAQRAKYFDLKKSDTFNNIIFTGNPGTGKTTVARLMGRIFKALGILRKGHVVEVSRSDLIAAYVGQTAQKTRDVVKSALDGVLFVDEAYSLLQGGEQDFGKEALNQLLLDMGNNRDRLIVIAAGYPAPMQTFINSNPGFARRFPYHLDFPDYTRTELVQILKGFAEREHFLFSDIVLRQAGDYLMAVRKQNPRNFGNAGTVEILFEEMKGRLGDRVFGQSTKKAIDQFTLSQFVPDDVPTIPGGEAAPYRFDLVSLLPQNTVEDEDVPVTVDSLRRAVLFLSVLFKSGEQGSGTSFLVTPQGHLLTAYHLIKGAEQVTAQFEKTGAPEMPVEVLATNEDSDLAVLRLPPGSYHYCRIASRFEQPKLGGQIAVLGYPLGEQLGREITYTTGVISSLREQLIQIDAAVTHGSSGGPLLSLPDLQVIGVIHGGVKQEIASGLNFAVSVQEIYHLFGR
jgi:SpoVK/Ycf46/Vps4 family AAA+-type ATPase